MRILKFLFLLFLFLIIGSVLASKYFETKWSKDIETLDLTQNNLGCQGIRNEVGVWSLKCGSDAALWFSMGYLHGHDREFQTELFRYAALGRLSEIFGKIALNHDKLARFEAHYAKKEWDALAKNQPQLANAISKYISGRRHFYEITDNELPVEHRFFSLKRDSFIEWEPWHILALVRMQVSEFSFDSKLEFRRHKMSKVLGPELSALILRRPELSSGTYESFKGSEIKKTNLKKSRLEKFAFFKKEKNKNFKSALIENQLKNKAGSLFADAFDSSFSSSELGASNLWIASNKSKGLKPILCNDTHLAYFFPAIMYPIDYEVKGQTKGRGFSLSGVPFIVIGEIEKLKTKKRVHWGITLSNYADTTDFVSIAKENLVGVQELREKFVAREPMSGEVSRETAVLELTSMGPRIDPFYENLGQGLSEATVVNGPMYEGYFSPVSFFYKRHQKASDDFVSDAHNDFIYPAINIGWMESGAHENSGVKAGHLTTGKIFKRKNRKIKEALTSKDLMTRSSSFPWQRPYLYVDNVEAKDSFFFASANDQIYSKKIAADLAWSWAHKGRFDRIVDKKAEIFQKPESLQTDSYTPTLHFFIQKVAERFSSQAMCLGDEECESVFSELKQWDGVAHRKSWQTTVAAFWLAKFKVSFWPTAAVFKSPENTKLVTWWGKQSQANFFIKKILNDQNFYNDTEKILNKSIESLLAKTLKDSIGTLSDSVGQDKVKWQWANFHSVRYKHPFMNLPEPLNLLAERSLADYDRSVGGAVDSPGANTYHWSPEKSLDFAATHGAVMRYCSSSRPRGSKNQFGWSLSTGVSGNPFSKWSKVMAKDYFFNDKLFWEESE